MHRYNLRTLLLVLAYLASTLAPVAHHIVGEAAGFCVSAEAAPGAPQLEVACNGPCKDPTHHHHPRHDESRCATCQLTSLSQSRPAPAPALGAARVAITPSPVPCRQPAPLSGIRISPARAPPVSASC